MNKKGKTKRVRWTFLLPLAIYLLLLSSLLYFVSAVFLKSYNNSLATAKQNFETEIADLQVQNDEVSQQISVLSAQNRVTAITEGSLQYQAQNITTVTLEP